MKAKKDQQRWKTCGDIIAEYEFNINTYSKALNILECQI